MNPNENNNNKKINELNNLNNIINNVNLNIMNLENKFNNQNNNLNQNQNYYNNQYSNINYQQNPDEKYNIIKNIEIKNQTEELKNNEFNMGKIGFYNNNTNIPNNHNKMEIDDDGKGQLNFNLNNINSKTVKSDLELIEEIDLKHSDIKKILYTRKNTLKRLAKFCIDRDVPSTLNYLSMINELAIYNDFLNYSLLQTDTIRVPLTMDNASFLLSHVNDLINSRYENYKKVGIHSALVLLKLFSDRIITTKNSNTNGIDLSKEDRIKKCDKLIEIYRGIISLSSLEQLLQKKSHDEVSL